MTASDRQFDAVQFGDDGTVTIVFTDLSKQSNILLRSEQWTFHAADHPVLVDTLERLLEELVDAAGAADRQPADSIPSRSRPG